MSLASLPGAPALPAAAIAIRALWDEGALETALREAGAAADLDALWVAALAQHNLAVQGRRGAAAAAETALKALLARLPDHPVALAYMGNAVIMVARDSRNVMTKAGTVRKGLAFLDQAVERAPDDISIRLLRAGSGKRLPKLFGRRPLVAADLAHAARLLEADAAADPLTLAEVCWDLASLPDAPERAEQRRLLERALVLAPHSTWGRQAQARLGEAFNA